MNEREIFIAALQKGTEAERRAFLDKVCDDNPVLRKNVEALLKAHLAAGSFMESQAAEFARTEIREQITEGPGTVIGPYRLLEQIGEGGFGVVFMAEQTEPVRRRVALKVIKPGMDTRQVIARFEAERQALALMDHPHIARVLDGGATASGRPYFVMELVKGIPITQFCDQHQFSVPQRLELFVTVCQAVQHAHQKGIIHRDIKPSNVLVTLHDDRPVVKVIDFGVAKATSGQLTDKTLFTGFMQMLGTPLYMSPEQTALSGVDIDTRSDVYSLGVLLYELLTGATPFDRDRLLNAAVDEIRRIIREEEPKKPSTRLSTLGDSVPTLAVQRRTEPKKLGQLLRGDLDWIVMKALEKDRSRRYETANGFARDVQRYLADEVIEARPPTTGYRLRKVIRRNKGALTTVGLVALSLIIGTGISTWLAIRATRAEQQARDALVDVKTERDRAVDAEQRAQSALKAETIARVEALQNLEHARGAVDEFFTQVSQDTLFDQPNLQPLRKELLEAAVRFYEALLKQHPDDPDLLTDLALAELRMAPVYRDFNRSDDCIESLAAGLEHIDRLRREFPDNQSGQLRLAGFWKPFRGNKHAGMPKNPERVDRTLQKLVDILELLHQEHPDVLGFETDLAAAYFALANWRMEFGAVSGNETVLKQGFDAADKSIEQWERVWSAHPNVADYADSLLEALADTGYWLRSTGQWEAGKVHERRADEIKRDVVARFPDVPQFRDMRIKFVRGEGWNLVAAGQYAEAAEKFRLWFDLARQLSADYPGTANFVVEVCNAASGIIRNASAFGLTELQLEPYRREMSAELATLVRLRDKAFDSPEEQWALAHNLASIGDSFVHGGELAGAETAFRLSADAARKLIEQFPEEAKYSTFAAWAQFVRAVHTARGRRSEIIADAGSRIGDLFEIAPENGVIAEYLSAVLAMSLRTAPNDGGDEHAVAMEVPFAALAPSEDAQNPDVLNARNVIANRWNNVAWQLATTPLETARDPEWAVVLGSLAVNAAPHDGSLSIGAIWNTVGTAQFRVGDLAAAESSLRKAIELRDGGNSSDWYLLAMIDWQTGKQETAKHWFEAACLWSAKYAGGDEEQHRFRVEAAGVLGIEPPTMPEAIDDGMIGAALAAADPELECSLTLLGRVETAIRRWDWEGAKSDAVRLGELRHEDDHFQIQLTALLARTGDEADYRKICRMLLERHAETTDPVWAERVAKAALTLPATGDDLAAASKLAERAVTLDPSHWVIPFAQVAAALAAYRRGEFAAANDWCGKALATDAEYVWLRNTEALFVRAMALERLGEHEPARAAYSEAAQILRDTRLWADGRPVVDPAWQDFAICEVLQQEAEQVLGLPAAADQQNAEAVNPPAE